MPVVGFILAVLGSALYGLLLGVGWFAIQALRGAPGGTGMDVLMVPFLAVISAIAGAIAAAIALSVPRTSLRWSDSFVLLVAVSFAVQALAPLPPYLLATGDLPDNILLWTLAMSGPIDWNRSIFNLAWPCTIPLTLLLCSPWFRARFGG